MTSFHFYFHGQNPFHLFFLYRQSSIKPPGRGSLFNLETTMASVHNKELEYKAEKLKRKKVGGHADEPVIEPIY